MVLGLDQFFRAVNVAHKLALAHMLPRAWSPHFVGESTTLAFSMLVGAVGVETWVKLASGLDVCKLAAFSLAIGSVTADGHTGMLKVTVGVRAMREESAHGLCLVGGANRRRRVASGALFVLASGTE